MEKCKMWEFVQKCQNKISSCERKYQGVLSVFVVLSIFGLYWMNDQALSPWVWGVLVLLLIKWAKKFLTLWDVFLNVKQGSHLVTKCTLALLVLLPFFWREKVDGEIIFLIFAVFWVFLGLNGRLSFMAALVMLVGTLGALVFEDQALAEQFSVFLYYFLVIGVFWEIVDGKVARYLESDFSPIENKIKNLIPFQIQNFLSHWGKYLGLGVYLLFLLRGWFWEIFVGIVPVLFLAMVELGVLVRWILSEEDRDFLSEAGAVLYRYGEILVLLVAMFIVSQGIVNIWDDRWSYFFAGAMLWALLTWKGKLFLTKIILGLEWCFIKIKILLLESEEQDER